MHNRDSTDGGKITFRYYVLALVDVLNQSEQVQRLGQIPRNEEEESAFIRAIQQSIGVINKIREGFHGFFAAYQQRDVPRPVSLHLTAEKRKSLERIRCREAPRFQHFSDTVLVYVPVVNSNGEVTVDGIYSFLAASAGVMLYALAHKIAIRGAIDVGVATECWSNEIYGTVLYRAHYLEEKVAQHPRIVVGPGLLEFLKKYGSGAGSDDLFAQWNSEIARFCTALIAVDEDGVHIVDYLGAGIRAMLNNEEDLRPEAKAALSFAKREHERFVLEGDFKLAQRYAHLRRYLEAKCGGWVSS